MAHLLERITPAPIGTLEIRRCLPHRRSGDARFIGDLYSKLTGRAVGKVTVQQRGATIDHGDGQRSAAVRLEPIRHKVAEHGDLNEFRRNLYDKVRAEGMTHDEALALFPEGKVTV